MNYCELCFLSLFDLMLISSRTSAYYSKSYGEYNLTIRDNAGGLSQWTTQTGAQEWCKNNLNGSSLASVTNSDLQTNIEQFANETVSVKYLSENNIILNAQLELTPWLWLNGQNLSSDTSNCGDNRFKFHERCYRKYDNPKVSWFEARINCLREGGDLASFDYLTKDTLSTLNSSALYPVSSADYWVGFKRIKWKWPDSGSEANFTYWSDGHPSDFSKKCICLGPRNNYKWKWLECDCNAYRQFICFTVLSQTTTLRSAPISSLNPTPVSSTPLKPLASSSSSSLAPDSSRSAVSSLKSSDVSTTPANSSESSQLKKSDQALAVGLGVGLGVGVPLIILFTFIVALLVKKRKRNFKRDVSKGVFDRTSKNNSATTNDQSLNDVAVKKPDDDVGNPALGGTTLATDGEVANPYEVLKTDARNNDHLYQELSNCETIQTDS